MRPLFVMTLATTVVLDVASGSSSLLAQTSTNETITVNVLEGWTFGLDQVFLVVLLIALLALLFWLQMKWSQKLEQASYLGKVYRDSVVEFEFNRLSLAPKARMTAGEYRDRVERSDWFNENPPPPRPQMPASIESLYGRSRKPGGGPGSRGDPRDDEAFAAAPLEAPPDPVIEKERRYYEQQYTEWALKKEVWNDKFSQEERRHYNEELQKAREEAIDNAEKAVDVDLAVLAAVETVAARAERFRRAQALNDLRRQFRDSPQGVAAGDQAAQEFSESLRRTAAEINAAGARCRIEGPPEGYTLVIGTGVVLLTAWRRRFPNTLDEARLVVEFYDGVPRLIPPYEDAHRLERNEFEYGLAGPDRPAWLDASGKEYSSPQLAEKVLKHFVELQEQRLKK